MNNIINIRIFGTSFRCNGNSTFNCGIISGTESFGDKIDVD